MEIVNERRTSISKFCFEVKVMIVLFSCFAYNKSFSQSVGLNEFDNLGSSWYTSDFFGESNFTGDISLGYGSNCAFKFGHQYSSYKFSMGNGAEYKYGPVIDYSIKTGTFGTQGNGFSWGISGLPPIAAISNQGIMQVDKSAIAASMKLTGYDYNAFLGHRAVIQGDALVYANAIDQYITGNVSVNTLIDKHLFFKINNTNILDFYKDSNDVGIDLSNDLTINSSGSLYFVESLAFAFAKVDDTPAFLYGPVTSQSLKWNTSTLTDNTVDNNGWTWGISGQSPVAALSSIGELAIKDNVVANNAYLKSSEFGFGFLPLGNVLFGHNGVEGPTSANYAIRHSGIIGITSVNATENQSVSFNVNNHLKAQLKKTGDLIVHSRLGIGEDNVIDGAALTVDGRMYISDHVDDLEKGFTTNFLQNNKYKDYLMWVEKGIVSADLAIVEVTNWPDYVFKANYKLPTLAEVEKFIKLNGHLHTMPSAKKVEEHGFTLKDMTKGLVQTVEELTLYAIEQDKIIDKQNETISVLLERAAVLQKLFLE